MLTRIDRFFGVTSSGSSWRIEGRAALTTWLSMCYILVVNPAILGTAVSIDGVDLRAELLSATALCAGVGCCIMGLLARQPFAIAPGMGLNAYFAYTVVLGRGVPWQTALGAVFVSGVCFTLLSVAGVRAAVVRALPRELRVATTAGIGLFLAHLGLQASGIVVEHPATLVTLGDVTGWGPTLTLMGLTLCGVLMHHRVTSAIWVSMLATTALAIACEAPVYAGQAWSGLHGGWIQWPAWPVHLVGALDIAGALQLGLFDIVFVFLFVDFFDTAATLVALTDRVGTANAQGHFPRATLAYAADALATCFGAILGTSTATSYIESATGIEAGGRTGATALGVGLLFFGSLALWPLATAVPGAAVAPALLLVGAFMLGGIVRIDWHDTLVAIPSMLTLTLMPLTFSIANGISAGIVAWTTLHLCARRRVDPKMVAMTVLLIARYAWLSVG